MKMKLKEYLSPEITMTEIFIEEGIAASSVTVQPGGQDGTPDIEDWDEETDSHDWEF